MTMVAASDSKKEMLLAAGSEVMGSCPACGLAEGRLLAGIAGADLTAHSASQLWQNLPMPCNAWRAS